jgi:hypothetical protein
MLITLDIETNTKHDTIWCVVTEEVYTGNMAVHTTPETLAPLLRDAVGVIGHNIIGFDAPVLEKVWNLCVPSSKQLDTLVLSRLYNPSLEGGHSLDSWGKRLGDHKIDFSDYDGGLSDEMVSYCKQDVKLTTTLYKYLINLLNTEGFSDQCVDLEHQVAIIMAVQERNGFVLDVSGATVSVDNSPDEDHNSGSSEGISTDSGGEMVGEDGKAAERQGNRVQCGVTEADSREIDSSRCYILSDN